MKEVAFVKKELVRKVRHDSQEARTMRTIELNRVAQGDKGIARTEDSRKDSSAMRSEIHR